jgi:hypothetical protein
MKRRVPTSLPSRRTLTWVALALALFGTYYASYEGLNYAATGDEPHYLIEARSLAFDGDRDMRNNYADPGEVKKVYGGSFDPCCLQAYDYHHDGRLFPIHNMGLPLLLAAPIGLDAGLLPARLALIAFAVLAALQLLGLLRDLRVGSGTATFVAWAAVAFSVPLTGFAAAVYPEVPAALLVLTAGRAIVVAGPGRGRTMLGVAAVAFLPWLHVRYGLLAVALGIGLLWRARRGASPAERTRATRLVTAPLALSVLALGIGFYHWYGSPLPSAAYKMPPVLTKASDYSLGAVYSNTFGSIFGADFGWLTVAPVHLLALTGIPLLVRRWGTAAGLALLVVVAYVIQSGTVYQGYSLPGRYLVPVIPLVAIPLALLLDRVRPARWAVVPLLALTIAFSVNVVKHAADYYAGGKTGVLTGQTAGPLGKKFAGLWPDVHPRAGDRFPGSALVLAWLGALAFVAALAAGADERRRTV